LNPSIPPQITDRLEKEHKLHWLTSGQLVKDPKYLKQVDLFVYLVDKPHCNAQASDFDYLKPYLKSVTAEKYPYAGPKREEQSCYFWHLYKYYETMADFVIFTHPDTDEHVGEDVVPLKKVLGLLSTNSELAYESVSYYPLAMQ
jgi:hypothetical protein